MHKIYKINQIIDMSKVHQNVLICNPNHRFVMITTKTVKIVVFGIVVQTYLPYSFEISSLFGTRHQQVTEFGCEESLELTLNIVFLKIKTGRDRFVGLQSKLSMLVSHKNLQEQLVIAAQKSLDSLLMLGLAVRSCLIILEHERVLLNFKYHHYKISNSCEGYS